MIYRQLCTDFKCLYIWDYHYHLSSLKIYKLDLEIYKLHIRTWFALQTVIQIELRMLQASLHASQVYKYTTANIFAYLQQMVSINK